MWVLASFPPGSRAPLAVDLDPVVEALSSPSAPALAIELVGRTDATETGDGLAEQRAAHVAQLIRAGGISEARIRVRGVSASTEAAASNPVLDRRVDGRLFLQGAETIRFAIGSAKIRAETDSALDRLASLLNTNFGLRLHLQSADEAEAEAKAAKRLMRVRKQLVRRGVDEDRVEIALPQGERQAVPLEAVSPSVEVTVIAIPTHP